MTILERLSMILNEQHWVATRDAVRHVLRRARAYEQTDVQAVATLDPLTRVDFRVVPVELLDDIYRNLVALYADVGRLPEERRERLRLQSALAAALDAFNDRSAEVVRLQRFRDALLQRLSDGDDAQPDIFRQEAADAALCASDGGHVDD